MDKRTKRRIGNIIKVGARIAAMFAASYWTAAPYMDADKQIYFKAIGIIGFVWLGIFILADTKKG